MKTRVLNLCLLLLITLSLYGCAAGKKYSYDDIDVVVNTAGSDRLLVSAVDHRYFVQDKTKAPTWVGLLRDSWNAPFDVHTASRHPLGDDVARVVRRAMARAGYQVIDPKLVHDAPLERFTAAMEKAGVSRGVVVILKNWWTDTSNDGASKVKYQLQVKVYGEDGAVIAEHEVKGEDQLTGKDALMPGSNARVVAADAMKKYIEALLNEPAVSQALGGGA